MVHWVLCWHPASRSLPRHDAGGSGPSQSEQHRILFVSESVVITRIPSGDPRGYVCTQSIPLTIKLADRGFQPRNHHFIMVCGSTFPWKSLVDVVPTHAILDPFPLRNPTTVYWGWAIRRNGYPVVQARLTLSKSHGDQWHADIVCCRIWDTGTFESFLGSVPVLLAVRNLKSPLVCLADTSSNGKHVS